MLKRKLSTLFGVFFFLFLFIVTIFGDKLNKQLQAKIAFIFIIMAPVNFYWIRNRFPQLKNRINTIIFIFSVLVLGFFYFYLSGFILKSGSILP